MQPPKAECRPARRGARAVRGGAAAPRRGANALVTLGLLAGTSLALCFPAFVPPLRMRLRVRRDATGLGATKEAKEETAAPTANEDSYDWQRIAEAEQKSNGVNVDILPDLPDFGVDEDENKAAPGTSSTGRTGTVISEREISEEEIMGITSDDLVPPEPNPFLANGLGLMEWTGLWVIIMVGIGIFIIGIAYLISMASLDRASATTVYNGIKSVLTVSQVFFAIRVICGVFPDQKSTDLPWAISHYPTEWILSPMRMVFKPEAGLDIAPIICFATCLLGQEILVGPSGIFQNLLETM